MLKGVFHFTESEKAISQAELLVALFKDGKLVEIQPKPIGIAEGKNTLESPVTDYTGSDTVKIMIWDSIKAMKPLFNCGG